MRLHTDGSTVVLLCSKGRLTWRKSVKASTDCTTVALPPNTEVLDECRDGFLCLTPSGERDFSARLVAAGATAAAAFSEDKVAATIIGEETHHLVHGPVRKNAPWPRKIDLREVSATRIAWPAGLLWKKSDKTMYDMAEEYGSGVPECFTPNIESNGHGTALATHGSGTVLLVRPDSDEIACSFQLPSHQDASIYAYPSKEGVFVTVNLKKESGYIHIAQDGSVLGHRACKTAMPALGLDAGFLIFDGGKKQLELVDAALQTTTSLSLGFAPVESAMAVDNASFALADDATLVRGHRNAAGELVIVESLQYGKHTILQRPGEIAAKEARWDPARCHGKAGVGFAVGMTTAPWNAEAGHPFELIVHARSTGGKGKGISIAIGGDATKHCDFEAVEVEGVRVDLVKDGKSYKAEFPNVELIAGLEYPLNPKPKNDAQKHAAVLFLAETHIELTVFGTAHEVSSDLMSVSVSALRTDAPPLKWMRPLTVS